MTSSSLLLKCLLALVLISSAASARAEYIIVSGGPALRKWEDLRRAGEQHDRWWGNFIATATTRIRDIRQSQPALPITWLVYRDSYASRGAVDSKPYLSWIQEKQAKLGIKIVFFSSGNDVINYINGCRRGSITGFEYFGHSNKFCFLFDYSSQIYGVSAAWLHQNDLKRIHGSAFAPNAYCQSWGCHTGEAMSYEWKKATGLWMVGAFGKTDYSDLHLRDNHVGLSTGSHWRKTP
jgi:hypothetical protein